MPGATLRSLALAAVAASQPALGTALPRVESFLAGRRHPGGGFRGRDGLPDLYYTMFLAEVATALDLPLPPDLPSFLDGFADGASLDLVHLACLARIRATVAPGSAHWVQAMAGRLEFFRSGDGGFAQEPGQAQNSAYGGYLAFGMQEDLGLAGDLCLVDRLETCRAQDGGYANDPGQEQGVTPITAGALVLQCHTGRGADARALAWLQERLHPAGGFAANPAAPVGDLLSTATALLALDFCQALAPVRQSGLEFLDAVWDEERGGFAAHPFDATLDGEYLWYGLLSLGLLTR